MNPTVAMYFWRALFSWPTRLTNISINHSDKNNFESSIMSIYKKVQWELMQMKWYKFEYQKYIERKKPNLYIHFYGFPMLMHHYRTLLGTWGGVMALYTFLVDSFILYFIVNTKSLLFLFCIEILFFEQMFDFLLFVLQK